MTINTMKRWTTTAAILGLVWSNTVLAAAACSSSAKGKDIVDTAVAAGQFNTLAAALQAAGLVDALKSDGPFTVFAPTDAAFARLPHGTVETLLKPQNRDQLVAVLTYHVVPGTVKASQVVNLTNATTLNGQQVDISVDGSSVKIDNAKILTTDILCRNGVIHVIDAVILPSGDDILTTATKAGSFNTLAAAVKAAGLVDALSGNGPFTVLAPTDEAFARLPDGVLQSLLRPENKGKLVDILKYHVISGRIFATDALQAGVGTTLQGGNVRFNIENGKVQANNATVAAADVDASNGVIHVIDTVLLPPDVRMGKAPKAPQLIEFAIAKGVPLYNSGQPDACAAVYEMAAQSLLSMEQQVPAKARERLMAALVQVTKEHSAAERAWTLRYALDDTYTMLH